MKTVWESSLFKAKIIKYHDSNFHLIVTIKKKIYIYSFDNFDKAHDKFEKILDCN